MGLAHRPGAQVTGLPGTLECSLCHRRFGGTESYERHFKRREDRCKTIPELKKSRMVRDMYGVWRRQPMQAQTVLVDKRTLAARGRYGPQLDSQVGSAGPLPSVGSAGTPTDTNGGQE